MKYYIKTTLIIGICLAASCQTPTTKKMPKPQADLGKEMLHKTVFVNVVKDLFLVEAYKSAILLRNTDTLRNERLKGFYTDVFKKNGVIDTAFFNTFRYYELKKHKELEEIFADINKDFNLKKPR